MLTATALVLCGVMIGQDAGTNETSATEPVKVYVGVYINEIEALRLKDNQFVADFYIWFRWQGDHLKPIDSFEIANGQISSKTEPYVGTRGDYNYAYQRVVATITQFWDVRRFPLDNHVLSIAIEDRDNEGSKIQYIADSENSGVDPQVRVPGCSLGSSRAEVLPQLYKTNYGDISLPKDNESAYSRFRFTLQIVRQGWGYFLKLLFGLFVATAIAFLAFWIDPTHVDPRFGLGVGAIFAAVASEYVVSAWLPESSELAMVDALHILSFFVIFLSLAESTVSLKLHCTGDATLERASRRLDQWSFFGLGTAYVAVSAWLVLYY